MKWENRQRLRDALLGKTVKDVVFHDSHGMVVDIVFDTGPTLSMATYDDGKPHEVDDFYIGLDKEEL